MSADQPEPGLPYTPTLSGRRARVGYLGFDGVSFNDLWPLFAGLAASLALGLDFFVAGRGPDAGWPARTLLAAAPLAAGIAYLRLLVVGRPPHFKGDLAAHLLTLRLDFTDPPWPRLPLVPRVAAAGADRGPSRAADLAHPRRRWAR